VKFGGGISIGQFIPGESPVHRLDPRGKIIATFVLLAGLFMTRNPWDFIPWAALLVALSALSGIKLGVILRSGRTIVFLVAITVFLNLFWTPGRTLLRIGPLKMTAEGLSLAFCMGLRLFFIVIFTAMMMMTTSPMSFSDGLERLFSPLSLLRFPVSEMAMMMTIALRFIPTLFEETDRILKAQISRGADFDSGGLIHRARSFIPVLVPLFVLVFQRAENLATAMESRCYVPGAQRSRLNPLVWGARDTAAVLAAVMFVAASVAFGRYLPRAADALRLWLNTL
jgi:energy-coupling factor transport system permease protein